MPEGLSKGERLVRGCSQEKITEGILGMDSANDMKAARKTYSGFIGSLKWAVPLIAVIAFIVVLIISG